jgi:hypothetical protein
MAAGAAEREAVNRSPMNSPPGRRSELPERVQTEDGMHTVVGTARRLCLGRLGQQPIDQFERRPCLE